MPYLLKLSIGFAAVYLFYLLFLRRLTFHNWNRWYLLLYPAVVFIIPMVDVSGLLSPQTIQGSKVIQYIPALTTMEILKENVPLAAPGIDWQQVFIWVIGAGSLVLSGRLVFQYWSLRRIQSGAELIYADEIKIYQVNKPITPFSFGRSVYINQSLHNRQELKEIIRHEFVHVKQRHSIDMIWAELLCILNWYNPFAWLIRRAIRQNLEFIADQQVLSSGLDKKQYQYILLKVTGMPGFSIAASFNLSSLKKRIAMMNKNRTTRIHLSRFLLMLPVVCILLFAFRTAVNEPAISLNDQTETIVMQDTVPAKAMAPGVPAKAKGKAAKAPGAPAKAAAPTIISVKNEDGTTERYDLRVKEQAEDFRAKYTQMINGEEKIIVGEDVFVATPDIVKASVETKLTEAYVAMVKEGAPVEVHVSAIGAEKAGAANTKINSSREKVYNAVATTTYQLNEEQLVANFNNSITAEQLSSIAKNAEKYGLEFRIEDSRYEGGKLVFLKGSIRQGSTINNFNVTDFQKLQIKKVLSGAKPQILFSSEGGTLNLTEIQQ